MLHPASQGGTQHSELNLTRLTVVIGILFRHDSILLFTRLRVPLRGVAVVAVGVARFRTAILR